MAYEDSQNVQRQERSPSRSKAKRLAAQGKPPESSEELAERVMECRTWTKGIGLVDQIADAAALINAYVVEREEKILTLAKEYMLDGDYSRFLSALDTTRASQRSPREEPR